MKKKDKMKKREINNQKQTKTTEAEQRVSLQKMKYYNMITIEILS